MRRDERGTVTAEFAMVLPAVLAVVVAVAWMLDVIVVKVRVVDAAREAARAGARGDTAPERWGSRVAPEGAAVSVSRSGSGDGATVRAEVVVRVTGPAGIFRFAPVSVSGSAVAAAEPAGPSG